MDHHTEQPSLPGVELAVMDGDGGERKFEITPLGARFTGHMGWAEWRALLKVVNPFRRSGEYILSDVIAYGRKRFGDERVNEAITEEGFEFIDIVRAHSIGQTTLDLRTQKLLSEHYYVLGSVTDEKARTRWATIAEDEGLTPFELKKSIEEGKIFKQEDTSGASGRNAGIANVQGMRSWFDRWLKQAGGIEEILHWPKETKQNWLKEVRPVVELAQALEGTL